MCTTRSDLIAQKNKNKTLKKIKTNEDVTIFGEKYGASTTVTHTRARRTYAYKRIVSLRPVFVVEKQIRFFGYRHSVPGGAILVAESSIATHIPPKPLDRRRGFDF